MFDAQESHRPNGRAVPEEERKFTFRSPLTRVWVGVFYATQAAFLACFLGACRGRRRVAAAGIVLANVAFLLVHSLGSWLHRYELAQEESTNGESWIRSVGLFRDFTAYRDELLRVDRGRTGMTLVTKTGSLHIRESAPGYDLLTALAEEWERSLRYAASDHES